jgi:S1-C subfamily serine protease
MKQLLRLIAPLALMSLVVSCSDAELYPEDEYLQEIQNLEEQLEAYRSNLEDAAYVESRVNAAQQTAMKANIAISTDEGIGSGVVFNKKDDTDGKFVFFAITNYHVIEDIVEGRSEEYSLINYLGYTFEMDILAYDESVDLALVSFVGEYYDAYVLDFSVLDVQIDEFVLSMGSPQGQLNTLTVGWVLETGVSGGVGTDSFYSEMIFHSAPVDSGNSGGALINADFDIIGINSVAPIVEVDFPFQSVFGYAISYLTIEKFLIDNAYSSLLIKE